MPKTENVTGTSLLRNALKARLKKPNITNIAREIGVAMPTLEAFSAGTVTLAPEVLMALTPHCFPTAIYDPIFDRLRPAITTTTVMTAYPPRYVPGKPHLKGGLRLPKQKPTPSGPLPGWAT